MADMIVPDFREGSGGYAPEHASRSPGFENRLLKANKGNKQYPRDEGIRVGSISTGKDLQS